ncbi:MAG: hypothetical protein IPG90_21770 [Bacteroidetes bacterium]|nr:hypothetical protein [Bacteroidota bacterium]
MRTGLIRHTNLVWDSAYVITCFAHADSVRFYMKGNGSFQANRFRVYGGPDTTNMTLIQNSITFLLHQRS